MTLRVRVGVVLGAVGLLASAVFAVITYRAATAAARKDAHQRGLSLVHRTVETFMVSTRRFDQAFQAASTPEQKRNALNDWNRTIEAVDTAVIHDFGASQPRVRLIGDKDLVGYKPLGGAAIAVQSAFEREAIERFKGGAEAYEAEEDNTLRFSVPLWSDAHRGCGNCHVAVVEGLEADLNKRVLLGTLNVYIPMGEQLAQASASAIWDCLSLAVAVFLLVGGIVWYVQRGVVRPVLALASSLNGAADQVAQSSGQLAQTSQHLAQGANEQASSVQQASSSLEELTSVARANQDRSAKARESAEEASRSLQRSDHGMKSLVGAIGEIRQASQETRKIVKTIDEIAFQTNILALNAAVEAARAGEAGAGFAVVADEVRSLAQRAADAARNTATLIDDTVAKVGAGAVMATETQQSHASVGEAAEQVVRVNHEIAEASSQQTIGIEMVNRTISEIQGVVQQVAAQAEQAASASQELSAQAEIMKHSSLELRRLVC